MKSLDLILGLYDDPDNQTQENYSINLYRSNLAVFGSSMRGKTTLLKTLLMRLHQVAGATRGEEIYILDFSNDLAEYGNLPYVCAYFDALNEENVRRIFKYVGEKLSENIKTLHGKMFTDYESPDAPPHITFILDGLNAFMSEERYSVYHEALQKLARDGLSKGVSIVFTANEPSLGIPRIISSFNRIIAFDLQKDKYSELFSTKIEKPMVFPGRGLINLDSNNYEFQAYLPYDTDEKQEESAIQEIEQSIIKMANGSKIISECKAKRKKHFTDNLLQSNVWNYTDKDRYDRMWTTSDAPFLAGLDYYTFAPICFDLKTAGSIAIYGKKEFGKSNLLMLLLEAAKKIPNAHFVFWEDGRGGVSITPIIEIIKPLMQEHRVTYCFNQMDFEGFLKTDCGIVLPDNIDLPVNSEENFGDFQVNVKDQDKFTVFIIQSRLFYQTTKRGGDGAQIISRLSSFLNDSNSLFIFSDVQRIASASVRTYFNNEIRHAFLLDDILRFVKDKGQYSVFGTQDHADLKERFGTCETGDGFYFNIERDDLTKLKFIKIMGEDGYV